MLPRLMAVLDRGQQLGYTVLLHELWTGPMVEEDGPSSAELELRLTDSSERSWADAMTTCILVKPILVLQLYFCLAAASSHQETCRG